MIYQLTINIPILQMGIYEQNTKIESIISSNFQLILHKTGKTLKSRLFYRINWSFSVGYLLSQDVFTLENSQVPVMQLQKQLEISASQEREISCPTQVDFGQLQLIMLWCGEP